MRSDLEVEFPDINMCLLHLFSSLSDPRLDGGSSLRFAASPFQPVKESEHSGGFENRPGEGKMISLNTN